MQGITIGASRCWQVIDAGVAVSGFHLTRVDVDEDSPGRGVGSEPVAIHLHPWNFSTAEAAEESQSRHRRFSSRGTSLGKKAEKFNASLLLFLPSYGHVTSMRKRFEGFLCAAASSQRSLCYTNFTAFTAFSPTLPRVMTP